MTDLAGKPITSILAQLTYSPLYIITVILALGVLIFLRNEKGCFVLVGKVWAICHIINYILAIYYYIANSN
ncbi:hypothetical protein ACFVR2_23475 [Gottfriedia sp. NPDC057991]|uniref:hypothetical protein n=1 Tax=Gottfriedia sp. NPDC057991 TaxID=3346298 RepID=UPI0036D79317